MNVTNYYNIFKIETSANLDAIKKAFRKEIAIYHPDNNPTENAKIHFVSLVEGFHILSNPERRKTYDTLLFPVSSEKDTPAPIEPIHEFQYNEWKQESQKKAETYRDYSLAELFVSDLFIEAGIEGLFTVGGDLLEGLGDSLGDVLDIF
ncbi:J domain-containing protein [Psychroserpens damuponensis]|uniref:J domain-containing protein n=1 Tax=Psychroserpens damuponensis TaxID=943936 RepID=UPI00058F5431|nr:DnaJ domain-containing protein [Psychroserpens damuponensis]